MKNDCDTARVLHTLNAVGFVDALSKRTSSYRWPAGGQYGLTRVRGGPVAGEALSDGDTLRRIWALPVPGG